MRKFALLLMLVPMLLLAVAASASAQMLMGHPTVASTAATETAGSAEAFHGTVTADGTGNPAPSALVGDQTLAPSADSNNAGVAQAFSYTATGNGTTSDIDALRQQRHHGQQALPWAVRR